MKDDSGDQVKSTDLLLVFILLDFMEYNVLRTNMQIS